MKLILFITVCLFLTACSLGLPERLATPSTSLPATTEGAFAQIAQELAQEHQGLTGVLPLMHGADAFAARMLLADVATRSIDAQYYIWRSDLTGHLLLERLQQAADRGVKVRLLLDDQGTKDLDVELITLQQHPNIEVRFWNPFPIRRFKWLAFTYDFPRLNRRMHNKSFNVDGHVSILGGRNVGDEYFSTGASALFVDLDVLVTGAVVADIQTDFDLYWNSPSAYPVEQIIKQAAEADKIQDVLTTYNSSQQFAEYRELLADSKLIQELMAGNLELEWVPVTLVSDSPAKGQGRIAKEERLSERLLLTVGDIQHKFDGVSAYFVPGARGVQGFAELEQQGVQVRMLTNALEATDVVPVHAGYAKRRKKLLQSGVELYELRRKMSADLVSGQLGVFGSSGASLHAKTFAIDGEKIFVGSFNFDPRSERFNTEMGVLIESPSLAESLHSAFDAHFNGTAWKVELDHGRLVWRDLSADELPALSKEPGLTLWRGMSLRLIGWLPVEWLL